jgi:hypothetical protein
MVNIIKVVHQIKHDALYNTIYWEVKDTLKSDDPSYEAIEKLILEDEHYLADYREINRHSELSSIQVKEIQTKDNASDEEVKTIHDLNENVLNLKKLENFSVDSSESAYSIWIGSLGVMFIFIFHNGFSLYSELYHTAPLFVYGLYAVIMGFTYMGYKKMKANHELQFIKYKKIYAKTKELISTGFSKKYFTYDDLYVS